YTVKYPNL
nr:Chain C, NP205-LCMV epitope, YTVKYPNL [synthetic construct]3P4M_F Chain F, NP205-LCMV epitope, YTVKYPNL [synthetic construct]